MKKIVHDSRAKLKALKDIVQEHLDTVHVFANIAGDASAFEISDVKRDGHVRIKLCNEAMYNAVSLRAGLENRGIACNDDGTFVYVQLESVSAR